MYIETVDMRLAALASKRRSPRARSSRHPGSFVTSWQKMHCRIARMRISSQAALPPSS